MIGAIVGDVIGSRYEFNPTKLKDFAIDFSKSSVTDDTACTIGIFMGIEQSDYDIKLREWAAKIITKSSDCGDMFWKWLSGGGGGYGSYANGSAMRCSAIGWSYDTLDETKAEARKSAIITHNCKEGVDGAVCVAGCIYLARNNYSKNDILNWVRNYYNMTETIDQIRPNYKFKVRCTESVPQSIQCFLEGNSYEDTVRNAVSLGGDADTMAAIAGSIAEAFWKDDNQNGIPDIWIGEVMNILRSTNIDCFNVVNNVLNDRYGARYEHQRCGY